MADNTENIGGVNVTIGADLSDLQAGFDQAQTDAQAAGAAIADAFASAGSTGLADFDAAIQAAVTSSDTLASSADEAGTAVENVGSATDSAASDVAAFGDAADSAGSQASSAASDITEFSSAVEEAGSSAQGASGDIENFGAATESAGDNATEASGGIGEMVTAGLELGGIVVGVEAVKELGEEALTAYASVQQATIAITQMTGSAQEATGIIEGLKDVAMSDALSFPNLVTAEQRMIAFGFSVQAIPGALQAAADAAAATGKSFDTVTSSMDRMSLSGTAASRQLANLGLSTEDLANVMGVSADQVAAAFKAMDPTERLQVIEDALGKFSGAAQAMATSVAGEWQNLKTQADFAFEDIGATLAPIANVVLPAAAAAVTAFASVWKSTFDVIDTVGTAIGSVAGAINDNLITPLKNTVDEVPLVKTAWNDFISVIESYNTYALVASGIKGIANEITTLTGGFDGLNGPMVAATQHFNDLAISVTGGKAALDAMALSFKQTQDATSGLGDQIPPVVAAMASAVKTASDAQTAYQNDVAAYNALKTAYQSGQTVLNGVAVSSLAVRDAQVAMDTAAKAAGIDINGQATAAKNSQAALQLLGGTSGDITHSLGLLNLATLGTQQNFALTTLASQTWGIQMLTNESQISALNKATGSFGITIMQQPTQLLGLSAALTDTQNKLASVTAAWEAGTATANSYLQAVKSATAAQEAFDVAQAEAAANTSGATDAVSLYTSILAGAQAKLTDVTNDYLSQTATAQQLLSAQKAVTQAQNDLNNAMGAAASPLATATSNTVNLGNANAAAVPAINSATAAMNAQAQAAMADSAAVADMMNSIGALSNVSVTGPANGKAAGVSYAFGSAGEVAQFLASLGFNQNVSIGAAAAELGQQGGAAGGTNPNQSTSGVLFDSLNPNPVISTGTTGTSSTTSTGVTTSGTSTLSTSGVSLIDEESSGTLYGQLDDILTALTGGTFSDLTTATQNLATATTANTDATTASITATDTAAAASTSISSVLSGSVSTLQIVGTSISGLSTSLQQLSGAVTKNVTGQVGTVSSTGTSSQAGTTGGGGTISVGNTPVTVYLGSPGQTGVTDTDTNNPNATQAPTVNMHFEGATFGSGVTATQVAQAVTPMVMQAMTQVLRTSGARF